MFQNHTMNIMLRNQQESPFLRLPGEIRNRIYDLVLGGKQILVLHPCLYSADRNSPRDYLLASFEPGKVRKLIDLTETCYQIHAETELHVFKLNDFRIASDHGIVRFLSKLSKRQTGAARTLVWPKKCQLMEDDCLLKFIGLQRLIVLKTGHCGGEDFYIPEYNATGKVHRWYRKIRRASQDRIDAWKARGIEVEYCE